MTPNGRKAARPFTARSLVGMTMGARKRAARNSVKRSGLKPYMLYEEYRIGERLRQCPGCMECDPKGFASMCDGSGVLPAKSTKAKRPA